MGNDEKSKRDILMGHAQIIELLKTQCVHYKIARLKRELDIREGNGKKFTADFERWGCFSCGGYNHACPNYFSPREAYARIVNGE